MNKKLKIFEGLFLPMEAIWELADYWKVADEDIGTIDSKGKMITSNDVWDRPCAANNYKVLRAALEESPVDWITLAEDTITVDFSKLHYNGEWLLKMFRNRGLGVCDSDKGLKLFEKRETSSGQVWFEDLYRSLRGVTVASLGLEKSEIVSLSPNPENPDYADWNRLYFAA